MRKQICAFILAAAAFPLYSLDQREPAPHFSAKTLNGEKFTNESTKGKVVLFQFWTTWCPYCRAEQDTVDAIAKEYSDQGLIVLAVNVGESRKKVKKYLEESPRSVPVVLTEDTNLAAMYAATSYPVYVLIDREGNVLKRQNGAGGETALRRMLAKAGIE